MYKKFKDNLKEIILAAVVFVFAVSFIITIIGSVVFVFEFIESGFKVFTYPELYRGLIFPAVCIIICLFGDIFE